MDRVERKKIKKDEFVEGGFKILQYLEDHPKPFLGGAVAIVLLAGAGYAIQSLSGSWAGRSADLLARGQAAFDGTVAVGEPAKPDDPYRPTFASDQERATKAAARLEEAADKASGKTAQVALYLRGVAQLDAGDASGAVSTLEAAQTKLGDDPTLGTSVRAALAQAYEHTGKADRAADAWRTLSADGSGYPKDLALTGLGRALARQGKRDEAKATLRQVIEQFPSSPLQASVKAELARLGG